jgi:hypothetical protein
VARTLSVEENKQLDNEAYRFMLDNPHGRRILWKLISGCGVYARVADNSGSWTYFKDGARSVGLNLIADICEADPEGYIKLQKQSLKEAK